jgi:hypothetical protein
MTNPTCTVVVSNLSRICMNMPTQQALGTQSAGPKICIKGLQFCSHTCQADRKAAYGYGSAKTLEASKSTMTLHMLGRLPPLNMSVGRNALKRRVSATRNIPSLLPLFMF